MSRDFLFFGVRFTPVRNEQPTRNPLLPDLAECRNLGKAFRICQCPQTFHRMTIDGVSNRNLRELARSSAGH